MIAGFGPLAWLIEDHGAFYAVVSGWLGVVGLLAVAWRVLVCHSRGCYRLARYQVAGTPYRVCHRCHPDVPDGGATRAQIHDHHARSKPRSTPTAELLDHWRRA